jgi:hypothetical protein
MLASSDLLASAAWTRTSQTRILEKCGIAEDINNSLSHWISLASPQAPTNIQERSQKIWDNAVTDAVFQSLLNSQTTPVERARLLAAAAVNSGDWLHALPISACGLCLNDEAVRVSFGIRLETEL